MSLVETTVGQVHVQQSRGQVDAVPVEFDPGRRVDVGIIIVADVHDVGIVCRMMVSSDLERRIVLQDRQTQAGVGHFEHSLAMLVQDVERAARADQCARAGETVAGTLADPHAVGGHADAWFQIPHAALRVGRGRVGGIGGVLRALGLRLRRELQLP